MTRFSDVVSEGRYLSSTASIRPTLTIKESAVGSAALPFKTLSRRLGVSVSVAVALAFGAAQANAQTAPAADQAAPVSEVVVTGSRIAAPNQTSASPIQVISSADIQNTGKTDISDVLYQMPQILNNDLGQDFSNRTSGLSTPGGLTTADLRGLGPNRTLVLVNGRRLGQGSPQTTIASPAPDLDQIPASLIDRVEVLTGGASSTYGSDAIAGVVNFIMKHDFQGVQVNGQYGINQHNNDNSYVDNLLRQGGSLAPITPLSGSKWDGKNQQVDIIAGTNFADNTGNITAYLTYRHQDPVASADRDFGQCQLTEVFDADGNVTGSKCFGSSNSNRFTPLTGPNANTQYGVLGNNFVLHAAQGGTAITNPPAYYNSQPLIYMQREDDRYLAGFFAHQDLADYAKPYTEFTFMDDKTHQVVAPAAAFTTGNPNTGGPYQVNCGNPFLSAQQTGIMGCSAGMIAGDQNDPDNQVPFVIGRRNVEGGNRFSDYEHMNFRAVVGMKGDFADAWNYDVYAQYYYVNYRSTNNDYLSYAKIDNALLVTGTKANPQCLSGAPCVPWNIFADGGVTPQSLAYLDLLGSSQGENSLRTVHADVGADLGKYGIKLPTARDGIGFNVGFEHRKETVIFAPDDATNSGQLSGAGGTEEPLDNSIGVKEEFAEVRVPLAQDLFLAKNLVFSTGFRHSDYSIVGGINTYKFDLQWAPIDDVQLRGSIQRAIRAPSVSELFDPQNIGLIAYGDDPCAIPTSPTGNRASLAQCLHTVSASQAAGFTAAYNAGSIPQAISGQLGQVQGGNPVLKPEKSKSYSAGFVFTPTAIPTLQGSIDWWEIKIDDGVGALPANVIVTNCLQTGNPLYCSQLVRSSTDYSLSGATVAGGGYILQTNVNIGASLTSGVDVQASYKMGIGSLGTLMYQLAGSYLLHADSTPLPGGGSYDCAGLYGTTCQTVTARWRHNARVTWQTPANVDVSANWRFISKVGLDNNDSNPLLFEATYGGFDNINQQLPNMSYFDLNASWHVTDTFELRGGIDNIFDKDPPIVTNPSLQGGGQANTFATYDVLGRQLFVAFTAKF